jgi:putative PIN family toxin of toxin-antitoxin system
MAVRAVIDTNIWVSALLNPFGFPAKVRKAFEDGLFRAVVSEPILEELVGVLNRPRIKDKYGLEAEEIRELLILLEERTEGVFLKGDLVLCRDPDDNFIIETAIKGQVQYLVTRDDDIKWAPEVIEFLEKSNIKVITVDKFLSILSRA